MSTTPMSSLLTGVTESNALRTPITLTLTATVNGQPQTLTKTANLGKAEDLAITASMLGMRQFSATSATIFQSYLVGVQEMGLALCASSLTQNAPVIAEALTTLATLFATLTPDTLAKAQADRVTVNELAKLMATEAPSTLN